jgi:hypothetical protein
MVAKQENSKPAAQKTRLVYFTYYPSLKFQNWPLLFFFCLSAFHANRTYHISLVNGCGAPSPRGQACLDAFGSLLLSCCLLLVVVLALVSPTRNKHHYVLGTHLIRLQISGWYFTHNNPDHTRPTAIGGSAEEGMNGPGGSSVAASSSTTHTGGLHKATYVSTTHASTTRASTSAAALPTDPVKRSDDSGLERIVRRAFGQGVSAGENQDLPVVVKQKVRKHQQAKRRAWDRMI